MLLSEIRVNIILIRPTFMTSLLFSLGLSFCFFLSLVISDTEIDDLPKLHIADIGHRKTSLKSSKDYVIERYVVFFLFFG